MVGALTRIKSYLDYGIFQPRGDAMDSARRSAKDALAQIDENLCARYTAIYDADLRAYSTRFRTTS